MAAFDWDDITEFFTDDEKESMTYNSAPYDCLRYKQEIKKETVDSGRRKNYKSGLLCKKADFSTLPQTDETVTFESTDYKIDYIDIDSTGKGLIIYLKGILPSDRNRHAN